MTCKFDIDDRVIWKHHASEYIKEGELITGTVVKDPGFKTHFYLNDKTKTILVAIKWDNGLRAWEEESDLTSQRYIREEKLKELGI